MSTLDVVTVQSVRDYLGTQNTATQFSAGNIGSNIQLASQRLQRLTNRQWEPSSETKTFTTHGREFVPVPDFRSVTSVSLNGAALTADSTYYAIPSTHESTIFIGLQFPRRRGGSYYAYPDWFDRNLDSPKWQGDVARGLPNDLAVASTQWGRDESAWPIEVIGAIRAFAGFLCVRPDALLSGAKTDLSTGAVFDLSDWPLEVRSFIAAWSNHDVVVSF